MKLAERLSITAHPRGGGAPGPILTHRGKGRSSELRAPPDPVYVRDMLSGYHRAFGRVLRGLEHLLEFHPWMLALAVILACAMGIAAMEKLRQGPPLVAQAGQRANAR